MKTILLLLCFATGHAFCQEFGRFQIVTGPVLGEENGKPITRQTLYRIDTVTGQTWRLVRELSGPPNEMTATFAEGWIKVSEDFAVSMDTARIAAGKPSVLKHLSEEELKARIARSYDPPLKSKP